MPSKARKAFLAAASILALTTVAQAQTARAPAAPHQATEGPKPLELTQTPQVARHRPVSDAEAAALRTALAAARRNDISGARAAMASLSDPVARKVATWALADAAAESIGFFEIDQARRDLAGWPRGQRRQLAAEKLLATSGQSPQAILAWFGGAEPQTAEGAMALASAYEATGRTAEAQALIRSFWRDKVFEAPAQRAMLARYGAWLTPEDHIRRADILLYGPQGPAAREMIALLPADHQQLAQARIALRANEANANTLASAVPAHLQSHTGLAFERAGFFRKRGLDTLAVEQLRLMPREVHHSDMASRAWSIRYPLILASIRSGDHRNAYAAAADSGLTSGGDAADAEFYAGWIALSKLKDPARADVHFANLEKIGSSPITRGRALYWRGRAAEARGDQAAAQRWYQASAQFGTTFYGQLAAEKLGQPLTLGADPPIAAADRARFEGRETVRAARLLQEIGERDLFRAFVLALDDVLPTAEELALLVDLARGYGDQDTSMKVVRTAAQRGFILPDRGYPVRNAPFVPGAPELALTMGITRQESGFDPMVRSHVGARGMMQLMPATAQLTAKRIGVNYSANLLDDPDYNMQLGQTYLAQMLSTFSGSYPMAIAAYNAGPGRPAQWIGFCGDPRTSAVDPIDFVECIPFSETRNYVMRVMEGMQVYRAKAAGGQAPVTLTADLKRGGYGTAYAGPIEPPPAPLPIGGASRPVPNP
ncbi:MAG: transglycosylase SLT domain-containing protein [Phenylobacterium sp.]|uniref:lytic transglycosylase domain-containing protein n=1 Tax=Phenylobacterium sp. TaxID=1871053 RepID=UPI00391B62BA